MKKLKINILCISFLIISIIPLGCSGSEKKTNVMTQSLLIFGMDIPGGGEVSEIQWNDFLKNYVTPHFKAGFTVIKSYGQYLAGNNDIIREKSRVIMFLYKNSDNKKADIDFIINKYKKLFKQECVLKIDSSPKVLFK